MILCRACLINAWYLGIIFSQMQRYISLHRIFYNKRVVSEFSFHYLVFGNALRCRAYAILNMIIQSDSGNLAGLETRPRFFFSIFLWTLARYSQNQGIHKIE